MIPLPLFSKPEVLSLENVCKIVPHLEQEQGGILIVVVTGLVITLDQALAPDQECRLLVPDFPAATPQLGTALSAESRK
jgi:hypothetical protein